MILSSVEELEWLIENEIQHLLSEQTKNAA